MSHGVATVAGAAGVTADGATAERQQRARRFAERRGWPLAIGAVTLLALALRLHGLTWQSVWWDEGWSVALARMPVAQMAESTAHDVHPPLYYLALQAWRLAAGDGEFALRYLSLWFGVLLVPLTYRLGRAVVSPAAGLVAALLVAVSPFSVAWSQEGRMYVVATALGLASTWLAVRCWRGGRGLWAYVLVSLALLYTLYLGIVFVMVQDVAWLVLLLAERRPGWRRWLAGQAAVALGLAPWLAFALARTRTWSVADPIGLGRLLYYYWGAAVTGTSAYIERHTPLLATLAACLLASAVWLTSCSLRRDGGGRRNWWRAVPLWAGALLPPLVVFVMSQPRSFLYSPRPEPRYLNPFAPLVYLLWAGGIAAAGQYRRAAGLALAVVAVGGLAGGLPAYYQGRQPADDYESMAGTLETYVQAGDLVLLHTDHDWPVFAYHYGGEWVGVPNGTRWDATAAAGFLAGPTAGRSTVWLAITTDAIRADAGMAVEQSLRQWCGDACAADEWRFGERRLLRLSRGGPLPSPSLLPSRPLAGPAGVAGAWWAGTRLTLGGEWRAYLWWDGSGDPPSLVVAGGDEAPVLLAGTVEGRGATTPVRVAYSFVPAEAGRYSVSVQSRGQWLLARLSVSAGDGATGAGTPAQDVLALGATFAHGVVLDGYSVDRDVAQPGDDLCVSLHWHTTQPVGEPYAVFVHLLGSVYNADSGNFLWGQHDGQPAGGTRPLPGWRIGEPVVDSHCFTVSGQAPAGTYAVEVGLYDRSSGVRLPLAAGGDSLIVGEVTVEAPVQ